MPRFRSPLDLGGIPTSGFVPDTGTAFPGSPFPNQFFTRTDLGGTYQYINSSWVRLDNTGTVASTRTITAGTGLSGGGDLSADRTLAVNFGTSAGTVAQGNDTRLSDSRTPTGAAGGDLAGTFPNPTIGGAKVVASKIGADITPVGYTLGATGSAGSNVPALRALGTAAGDAMAGSTRLNTIAAPTGVVSMASFRLINVADPTTAQDAATKAYVDAVGGQGLDAKNSVRLATTVDLLGVSTAGGPAYAAGVYTNVTKTIDGQTAANGDRVLVKDAATQSANGIFSVSNVGADSMTLTRSSDFNSSANVTPGAFTFVEEGTANGDTGWVMTANGVITIETTAITWTQFSSAGSITTGNGLTKAGSVISAVGTANRIVSTGAGIDIASNYVGQTSITTVGTISQGTWNGGNIGLAYGGTGASTAAGARAALSAIGTYISGSSNPAAGASTAITHNLNTSRPTVGFFDSTGPLELDWSVTSANAISVTTAVALTGLVVVVQG